MTLLLTTLTALTLAAGPVAQATPQTPADTKPAADSSIAGRWNVSIDTQNGPMSSVLEIKLDGKDVTGTITAPQGSVPIKGEYTDSKLTFTISIDTQDGPLPITFTGSLRPDGTLVGTATASQFGDMAFHAERIKDKHLTVD